MPYPRKIERKARKEVNMNPREIIINATRNFVEDDFGDTTENIKIETLDDCFDFYNHQDLLRNVYYYISSENLRTDIAMSQYEECIKYLFELYPKRNI